MECNKAPGFTAERPGSNPIAGIIILSNKEDGTMADLIAKGTAHRGAS